MYPAQQAMLHALNQGLNVIATCNGGGGKSAVVDHAIATQLIMNPRFVDSVRDVASQEENKATFILRDAKTDELPDLHRLPGRFVAQTNELQAVMDFAQRYCLPILSADNTYDLSTIASATCCVIVF